MERIYKEFLTVQAFIKRFINLMLVLNVILLVNRGQKGVIQTLANGAIIVEEIDFALVSKKDVAGTLAQQSLVALAVQHMAAGNQGVFYNFFQLVEVVRGDVVRLDVTGKSETVFCTPTP